MWNCSSNQNNSLNMRRHVRETAFVWLRLRCIKSYWLLTVQIYPLYWTVDTVKETLLNPDCQILNLLYSMKELAELVDEPGNIDLCTVQGGVANLHCNNPRSNARVLLQNRAAYVLVRVISECYYYYYHNFTFHLLFICSFFLRSWNYSHWAVT